MSDKPKPQTYVEFERQKVWFVGYDSDRPYEVEGPRGVVVAFSDATLGCTTDDKIKVWMGPPQTMPEIMNDIWNKTHELLRHSEHLPKQQLEAGILDIRMMSSRGLGLSE